MICPQCSSADVRQSQSSHWKDLLRGARDQGAYRCRSCRKRFFGEAGLAAESAQADGANNSKRSAGLSRMMRSGSRRIGRIAVISVFAIAFVLFLVFLFRLFAAPSGRMAPAFSALNLPIAA